jgi:hypothetical protein
MCPRMIVKEKVAIFIVSAAVLVINLLFLLAKIFTYLEFLLVLLVIFVGANGAFRMIDRRRKND